MVDDGPWNWKWNCEGDGDVGEVDAAVVVIEREGAVFARRGERGDGRTGVKGEEAAGEGPGRENCWC